MNHDTLANSVLLKVHFIIEPGKTATTVKGPQLQPFSWRIHIKPTCMHSPRKHSNKIRKLQMTNAVKNLKDNTFLFSGNEVQQERKT